MNKKLRKNLLPTIIIVLIITVVGLSYTLYKRNNEVKLVSENLNNSNLYELMNYVQNVETYLAKATISSSSTHAAETLTYLWREANLAQTYLASLPVESQELENTAKFLNQVSDYSYSLSRKNIKGEELTEEDFNNLEELHTYSESLEDMLNQLAYDLDNGTISWKDLVNNGDEHFAQSVSSELDMFSTLEENFHEYSGLIYDGAFSEHLTTAEPKGISGDEVTEEDAKNKVRDFLSDKNIQEITTLEQSQNTTIPSYNFSVKLDNGLNMAIAVTKQGAFVLYSNCNRDIGEQTLSYEEANKKGQEFLERVGITSMKETYYLNDSGVLTINYAYLQDNVIMYPDLIKVKVALDNGEILGFESTGYLNNHTKRQIQTNIITKEEAKKNLNKNLDIQSESLAIIPTEYKTEILCYEFKGKVETREFLVYINAETGREEDILVIYNTPNGTLTM